VTERPEVLRLLDRLTQAGQGRVLRYLGLDPIRRDIRVLGLAERSDGSMVLDVVEAEPCPVHGFHGSQGLYVVPAEVLEG
jgi:hypothetical protein